MAQMSKLYHITSSISGVPIVHREGSSCLRTLERSLTGLCWKTAFTQQGRRPGFPSWSWAGWHMYLQFIENHEPGLLDTLEVIIVVEIEETSVMLSDALLRCEKDGSSSRNLLNDTLHTTAPVFHIHFLSRLTQEPEPAQPERRALFNFDGMTEAVEVRLLHPASNGSMHHWSGSWDAVLLGQRATVSGAINSETWVALVVKRTGERSERVGIA